MKHTMLFGMKSFFVACAVVFSLLYMMTITQAQTQPTQQYNKIYLNPFYRSTMTNSNNYNYTITINPPDSISSVKSAIIGFDIYLNPSVNFTLSTNGVPCNTYFYYVSTTYASAGQSRVTFDCSNIITGEGTYTFTLRPSGANTGSVTGWLELTYMNNPKGSMSVSGTEYNVGDYATVFLQISDNQGTSINDATCYLDVYYPSYSNNTHPILYHDISMMYKNGSNGLYFFDMYAPNITGVYMLGALCSYSYDVNWVYPPEETLKKPARTVTTGTYVGDTFSLNSFEDRLYTSCITVGKICDSYYDFNTTEIQNITNLDVYYSGEGEKINTFTMSVWNWSSSSWNVLPNTLTFFATNTPDFPIGLGQFLMNNIPVNNHTINYTTKTVRIRLYTTGANSMTQWDNWLSLRFVTAEGHIQELKGSGEMHVSNALSNLTVNINSSQITDIVKDIWEYPNRNLTYYPAMDYQQVAEYVWNHTTRNLTDDLVSMVWNYPNRNLTYVNFTDVLNAIQNSNASIISELHSVNQSIFTKLYLIQGDLSYINTTTIDIDYWVKQNYAILVNLTLGNVTVFADLNWTRLREEVWNKTSQEKIENDLLSLSDNEVQLVVTTQDCLNDTTLLFTHQVQRCILGYCINETLTETAPCTYGCANHQCRPDPMWMYGMLILIIIGVGAGLYVINRFVRF